jgi:hypothetical protein
MSKSPSTKSYWTYGYYSSEGSNQSKSRASYSPEIDLINLRSLRSFSKYLTTHRRQMHVRKGGNTEIRPNVLMAPWV